MADKRSVRSIVSRLGGGLFALLLIAGFVWFVRAMMHSTTGNQSRVVQTIQVIRPPPPPPPDQPPPPPPEKTEQPLPKDEPEPAPDNTPAPADQPLGLDAEGAAGGDSFGLAARRGGSDLVGGTGSAPFAYYTNRIADAVREHLSSTSCTKAAKGSLSISLLLDPDGKFKQVQLATTTGNRQVDQCIDAALASMRGISDPAPPGMPEKVILRIVADQ
jgi:protein TonB